MLDAKSPPDQLARALAAAFPEWQDRSALVRESGLGDAQLTGDAQAVWRDLVDEAITRKRLDALLRAADARRAGWRNARWLRLLPMAAIGFAIAAVGSAYVGLWGGAPHDPPATAPVASVAEPSSAPAPSATVATAAPTPTAASTTPAPPASPATSAPPVMAANEPPAPSTTLPATSAVPTPASPPRASASVASPTTPHAPPSVAAPKPAAHPSAVAPVAPPASDQPPGSCAGRQGWAYLGTTTALVASSSWTTERSYNVHTDYPRRDNHYAMAPVICVLHPGDVVGIPDGPQPVDGGAFWIHVVAHGAEAGR